MKLREKILSFIVCLLVSSISVFAADQVVDEEGDYLRKIDLIYIELKDNLSSIEKTGDLNSDFLNQMVYYHRGLITLSKNELEFGERDSLKEPIDGIVDELKANLKKISKVQKEVNDNPVYDETKEAKYLASYEEIYPQILTNVKSEGENPTVLQGDSIDMDYLIRFSSQCETWKLLMNNVLTQTDDEEVKQLTEELIESCTHISEEIQSLMKKIEQ